MAQDRVREDADEHARQQPRIGVIGNLNIDLILRRAAGLPAWGQEVEAASHVAASSGQAGYLAMALGRLDAQVELAGRLGDDHYGRQILGDLGRHGVPVGGVEVSSTAPTGITVAIVREDGERAFVSDFGATRETDGALLDRHADRLATCDAVALVGLFNLRGLDLATAKAFLARLRAEGVATVLDTGWDPDGWSGRTVAGTRALLAEVDVFLPNLDECRALLGDGIGAPEAAQRLQDLGPRTVVVKCGADGSHGRQDDRAVTLAAQRVDVFDAVGAGDTFDGGFLRARADGADLEAAMRFGAATATHYLGRATERFPTRADVVSALAAPAVDPKKEQQHPR